jgi:flagellar FliL protein
MSNKVVITLVAVLFVVMLGLSAGLFMIWTKLSTSNAAATAVSGQDNSLAATDILGPIYPLDTFIVNLADEDGKRYLRITMNLELTQDKFEGQMEQRLPQVRDSILTILPTKRFDDIQTAEGKTLLRNEIIAKLNSLFGLESVSNIYFTEFVVQ